MRPCRTSVPGTSGRRAGAARSWHAGVSAIKRMILSRGVCQLSSYVARLVFTTVNSFDVGLDVDWRYGAEHMWTGHALSVREANEALTDVDAQLFDPDPKSSSGRSARVLGYSHSARAVLVVILVHRDDKPGAWWGANGWRANSTDRRSYEEGTQR